MTTPVERITGPALERDAAPANPGTGGLFTAATVENVPDPTRMDGGVRVTQLNCGTSGTWQPGCGPQDDADAQKIGAARADAPTFPTMIVWATDDCSLVGASEAEARTRAQQIIRLQEEQQAEAFIVGRLLSDAGVAATAPEGTRGLQIALGAVEQELGRLGTPGVIHIPRRLAPLFYGFAEVSAGGFLKTKLGNSIVFGTGYEGLGNTIVGTGPVTVLKGPVSVTVSVEHRMNTRTALAERELNVSWECTAVAQSVIV